MEELKSITSQPSFFENRVLKCDVIENLFLERFNFHDITQKITIKYLQIRKIGQICLKSVEIWPLKDLKFANESLLFWLCS